MSSKINIISVIRGHMSTLIDAESGKFLIGDLATFYGLPLIVAFIGIWTGVDFSKEATNLLVTAGAIFTGLLLNLLILVYDQKSKLPAVDSEKSDWKDTQTRHTVLKELYFNISYSTLMSVLLVVLSVIHLFVCDRVVKSVPLLQVSDLNLSAYVTTPLLVFIGFNLVLTIVMIIKRIYTLLSSE